MDKQIFLNSYDSKKSVNTSSSVSINLKGNRKLLPFNDVAEVISQYDQYLEERRNCNKIRLTCQVNTLCSNVLFNKITEIVKREGSNDVVNVNYGVGDDTEFSGVLYKNEEMGFWGSNGMTYQSEDWKVKNALNNDRSKPISALTNDLKHNDDGRINPTTEWIHPTNSIRDTQLSNLGFVYHCGLDFLNNHLVRSNTFRTVCKMLDEGSNASYSAFNTIADLMRDVTGHKICEKYYFPVKANVPDGAKFVAMHLYDADNIDTFEDAVKKKLIYKYDGWVGFENTSKIKSYSNFKLDKELNMERPLMYYNSGDFVDMYPSHDLLSFVPKYNEYQNRLEKNWNYCITYPSSSFTPYIKTVEVEGEETKTYSPFTDIIECNDGVNSMKAIYFDENTRSDNGTSQLVIYSIAKHGLDVGDYVNIYKTYTTDLYWVEKNGTIVSEKFESEDEASYLSAELQKEDENPNNEYSVKSEKDVLVTKKIIDNAEVAEVVDDYIFTVFNSYFQISKYWVYLDDKDLYSDHISVKTNDDDDDVIYNIDSKSRKYYTKGNPTESLKYYIVNDRYVNLDDTAQQISYKKVVGDIECEYYVRIFSKLPNFKYASASTSNEYEIYKNSGETISYYQAKEYEFENHLSKLAFAKNIYGDDIAEIVFTDDIDLSYLKDNLGRPLSSLYFTAIKNNQGYKEWYGFDVPKKKDGTSSNFWTAQLIRDKAENVEFSHCFGMITCGIDASEESIYDEDVKSIKKINNIDGNNGYDVSVINGGDDRKYGYTRDENFRINDFEVSYETDKHFYGDLCYYDAYNAIERVIQPILHRFNTSQRESTTTDSQKYYMNFNYDEIVKDDYDVGDAFVLSSYTYVNKGQDNLCSFKEGYYYNPHYEIPIKTFDKVKTVMPDFLVIRELHWLSTGTYKVTTLQKHFLKFGDKSMIYDRINEKYYILKTIENINDNVFTCTVYLDSDEEFACDIMKDENNPILSLTPKDDLYAAYKLFKIDNLDVPSYAKVLKDGTCRIIWRDLLNNGDSLNQDVIEEYPFTNGAFYVNKRIDLYTRRQDPHNQWGLYSEVDILGNEMDTATENYYAKEDEIVC